MPKTSLPLSLRNKIKSNSSSKLLGSKSTPILGFVNYEAESDPEFNSDLELDVTTQTKIENDILGNLSEQKVPDVLDIKRNFIDTLNLTTKQNYELYNVPNTFYYLRIRNYGEAPLDSNLNTDTLKKNASSHTMEVIR